MSDDSQAVIRFLEALQGYRAELGEIRNSLIQRGATNATVYFSLGVPFRVHRANAAAGTYSGTVSLGLQVVPPDGREADYDISIRWGADSWYIDTEIWAGNQQVNQRLLRTFPQRRVTTLDECLAEISYAIDDLRQSDELKAGFPQPQ